MIPGHFPFVAAFVFLFGVAMMRGQATYWLARVITQEALSRTRPVAGWKLKVHHWLNDGATDQGRVILNRWGLAAVALCYLTVGVQTIVLATAGVIRLAWPKFTLAQIPGALAWATIYSTIGFAVWAAAWEAVVQKHPWLALILLVVAVGLIALRVLRYRKSRNAAPVVKLETD